MISVMIKFASGQVGRMQVPEDASDGYIAEALRKATISWRQSKTESKWLPIVGWERVNANIFPASTIHRNAWRHNGSKVEIDMTAIEVIV